MLHLTRPVLRSPLHIRRNFVIYALFIALFTLGAGNAVAQSLNNAAELKAYLDKQPVNSPDKPIKVAMKATNMMIGGIAKAIMEAGKYVSLDLSGSPLTTIPDETFMECEALAGIIIPTGVTSIGERVFAFTSLISVTIPNGVTSIGEAAFCATKLTSITIPNSVTSIGEATFDSTNITSVTIPNGVTYIEDYTFSGCENLTSVTIPNGVTSIGDSAFRGCTSLTRITIPNSVTSIGEEAFWDCTSLTSVTIPNSVRYVGASAFDDWTPGQTINIQGKADRAATIAAGWDKLWDGGKYRTATRVIRCNAKINYGQ